MKKIILTSLFFISLSVKAIEINYSLKMPKPQNHYFEVEMKLTGLKKKSITVKMPTWAPGSYMIREFSKNVNLVKAFDDQGNSIHVEKTAKNAWKIQTDNHKSVKIKYEVYAFELSVRTSFLDLTHGYVNGSSMFMYVDGSKDMQGKIDIYPYEDFHVITTALPKPNDSIRFENAKTFSFKDYDQLIDCPIEIGNQEVFEFSAAGTHHTVAMFGYGNFVIPTLQKDMKKIVEAATNVFGQNPNKEYTFIIHNVLDGQGGLEHINSSTLSVGRFSYVGKEYLDFLSLVAHEYFHLWNVKRIRPIQLGPFDYDQENYTSLLWIMEGFTSYYDDLILRRADYTTESEYLQNLNNTLNYVEGTEGSRVQPLAHASYDAWIKGYRPNENSNNTTMTYYSRGQLIAALLDIQIVSKFNATKSLDDFMRLLYQKYYKKQQRGFSEKELEETLTEFMEEDMSPFLNDYVYDTKIPDYKSLFEKVAVKAVYNGQRKPSFGVTFSNDGSCIIKAIRSNSAAENAGLNVNDEVIGINGFKVNSSNIESFILGHKPGQTFNVLISREDLLIEIVCTMADYERKSFKLSLDDYNMNLENRNFWLRKI